MREHGWQGPTNGKHAETLGQLLHIIQHPAFRIGFLDAQHGKPLDHDLILDRIDAETPASALKRIGWNDLDVFDIEVSRANRCELAQYRYEEGRIAVIQEGLRCKAWGHPDFPPARVMDYVRKRALEAPPRVTPPEVAEARQASIVAAMRGSGLPLFEVRP